MILKSRNLWSNINFEDFIYERTDYERRYYSDPSIYLVTGHTPTQLIRKDMEPLIYEGAGHIAVDCGCVFGGKLAALLPRDRGV